MFPRSKAKPILRWAGSKRKLIPTLLARIPSHFNRYIEPFAGSACLFFALGPSRAVLGDINKDLMSTYSSLAHYPERISRRARSLSDTRSAYYAIRDKFNKELNPISRSVYFIYLNRYSFNGVYRTNRRGEFNVPRGENTGAIPSLAEFRSCSTALQSTKLLTADFVETIDSAKKGDFVYLDPPYSSLERPRYGEYGYGSFQPLQINELVDTLSKLDRRGVKFLMSYASSRASRKAFKEYEVEVISVRRHVAGFAKHRHQVDEVLISNYDMNS